MSDELEITPSDRLEMDIDSHIKEMREDVMNHPWTTEEERKFVMALVRWAFGQGMLMALNDPRKAREVCTANGYAYRKKKRAA